MYKTVILDSLPHFLPTNWKYNDEANLQAKHEDGRDIPLAGALGLLYEGEHTYNSGLL